MKVLPGQRPAVRAEGPALARTELRRLDAPKVERTDPSDKDRSIDGGVAAHLDRVHAALSAKSTPGSLAAVAEATALATTAAVEGLLQAIGAFTGGKASVDTLRRLVARTDQTLRQMERAGAHDVHLRPAAREALSALVRDTERALGAVWPKLSEAIAALERSSPTDATAIAKLRSTIASKLGALESTAKTNDAVPRELKAAAEALEKRGIAYEVVNITAFGDPVPGLKLLGGDAKGLGKLAGSAKAKLGVDLVYSPAALKQAGGPRGCYVGSAKLVLIDEATLLENRPTYVALHELRHAWHDARAARGDASLHRTEFRARGYYKLGDTSASYSKYMSAEELGTWVKMMAHLLPEALRSLGDGKRPTSLEPSPLPIIDITANMARRTKARLDEITKTTRSNAFLDSIEQQKAVEVNGDRVSLRWLGYESTVQLTGPAARAALDAAEKAKAELTEARKKLPKLLRYVSPEIQAKRAKLASAYRDVIAHAKTSLEKLESNAHAMRAMLGPAFEGLDLLHKLDDLRYYTEDGQKLVLEMAAKHPALTDKVDAGALADETKREAMIRDLRAHLIAALKNELPRAISKASVAVSELER